MRDGLAFAKGLAYATPDGSVYFSRSLSYLESVTPNGQSRWTFTDGGIIDDPIVSPDGALIHRQVLLDAFSQVYEVVVHSLLLLHSTGRLGTSEGSSHNSMSRCVMARGTK